MTMLYDDKAKNKDKCHTNKCDYNNKKFQYDHVYKLKYM